MQNDAKPGGGKFTPLNGNGYHLPKKIAILYSDVKREYFPTEAQFVTEKDSLRDALAVEKYINKLGVATVLVPGNPDLPKVLKQEKPDMALNLVGSVRGNEYLISTIPGILEFMEIPYTGTGILGMALDHNKFLVKKVFEQNGIPVPHYQMFNTPTDPLDPSMRFPIITKLNEIHGAVEITKDSVSENEKHLRERLKYLMKIYEQPVLAEEFIVGREITCYLLVGIKKKVYFGEKIWTTPQGKYVFADFESQWMEHGPNIIYRKFDDPLLREYVRKAFEASKMADYAKFDVRLDSSGRFYFIDSNANPFFGPKEIESPMANVLALYEVSFLDILKRVLINTMIDSLS